MSWCKNWIPGILEKIFNRLDGKMSDNIPWRTTRSLVNCVYFKDPFLQNWSGNSSRVSPGIFLYILSEFFQLFFRSTSGAPPVVSQQFFRKSLQSSTENLFFGNSLGLHPGTLREFLLEFLRSSTDFFFKRCFLNSSGIPPTISPELLQELYCSSFRNLHASCFKNLAASPEILPQFLQESCRLFLREFSKNIPESFLGRPPGVPPKIL